MVKKLHVFTGFGVEMEYMIVDRETLAVRPIAAEIMRMVEGEVVSETDQGALCWCNELVSHVIELKTNGPVSDLTNLEDIFQADVRRINELLAPLGAALMPTAMHPWMDPYTETVLWEHEYNEIYAAFNAIFDCRGHGWANLQSTHLNLPFANDEEFGRLHAAIRALLPLLPVLSASSPVMDGKVTGVLDNRLAVYRTNARKIPSVSGSVIPEAYFTEADYRTLLLQKIYNDLAPYDPDGILQDEWVNARGAIARFDRNTIEIRILDIQEFPAADVAIVEFISVVLRYLCNPDYTDQSALRDLAVSDLYKILEAVTQKGRHADINYAPLCSALGVEASGATGLTVWAALFERHAHELSQQHREIIRMILDQGNLAERISSALGVNPERAKLHKIYRQLMECLYGGIPFKP